MFFFTFKIYEKQIWAKVDILFQDIFGFRDGFLDF